MYVTKLNKPPPLYLVPPLKSAWKNKPPGGLIEDLQYVSFWVTTVLLFHF